MNKIIIISGPSGAGKTTLAQTITKEVQLPSYAKDEFKELLFDTLGWSDREWSAKLGEACTALLYKIMEKHLQSGQIAVFESNFEPSADREVIQALIKKYEAVALEIYCYAAEQTLFERRKQRVQMNQRHPGHNDEAILQATFQPSELYDPFGTLLNIGQLITLDTTNQAEEEIEQVIESIQQFKLK